MLQYRFLPQAAVVDGSHQRHQPWVRYSPIVTRPRITWPNEARVALWICPCIVFYEFVPEPNPWLDAWARTAPPDVMGYSRQDYGSRVGFWRMLDVLDKYRSKCTGIVNTDAMVHFDDVRQAIVDRGWDIAGHGKVNTQFVYGMSREEELTLYKDMRKTITDLMGVAMTGMGGAGPQAATRHTADLLAEAGYLYHTDWFCDDQPFPLKVRNGRLISMPYSVEINDTLVIAAGGEGRNFYESIKRQFDQLYEEGAESGRVMCISIHPNLIGQPHRIEWLDRALAYIAGFPLVWHATGEEIARHYLTHHYDAAVENLGETWDSQP